MTDLTNIGNNHSTNVVEPDVTDPDYTLLDWNSFKGSEWIASRQNCHQFGEITVITHKDKPTLKLFIAKDIAEVFEYKRTEYLTQILESENYKVVSRTNLNEIKDLGALFDAQNRVISPQGMKLVNYAGFNHAITHSTMKPAKIIKQWVYGNVMPKIAETGEYTSNKSLTQETEPNITITKEEYSSLISNLNYVQYELTEFKNKLNDIDDNQKQLSNFNKYQIPNKYFTLQESCDYLNTYFKNPWQPDSTPQSLITYLISIKMIKKAEYEPYVGFVKLKYIVRKYDPFNDEYVLKLSKAGIDLVITKLQEQDYI